MVLEECPFCHKFLAAQLMSREEADTGEILKEKDVLFKMGISIETGERIADQPEALITYKFTYRCKDCGKEWTKFSVKEVGLPEEYVQDELEKQNTTLTRKNKRPEKRKEKGNHDARAQTLHRQNVKTISAFA